MMTSSSLNILFSRLPLEVCEMVIVRVAQLPQPDVHTTVQSLYACSLVCRSWVPRSRTHIFRSVLLYSSKKGKRFIIALSTTPGLGEYVDELTITVGYPDPGEPGGTGWIHQVLSAAAPLLVNLNRLAFGNLRVLHPTFIALVSQLKTVRTLIVNDFRVGNQSFREIVQLTNRFKNLQDLVISRTEWKLPVSFYRGRSCSFTSLRVNPEFFPCLNDVLHWLVASSCTSSLVQIQLTCQLPVPLLDTFLLSCGPTLQTLELQIHGFQTTSDLLPCNSRLLRTIFVANFLHRFL